MSEITVKLRCWTCGQAMVRPLTTLSVLVRSMAELPDGSEATINCRTCETREREEGVGREVARLEEPWMRVRAGGEAPQDLGNVTPAQEEDPLERLARRVAGTIR